MLTGRPGKTSIACTVEAPAPHFIVCLYPILHGHFLSSGPLQLGVMSFLWAASIEGIYNTSHWPRKP